MKLLKLTACACICITTMAISNVIMYASGNPSLTVKFDSTGKAAEITVENVPDEIYSVQTELSISPSGNYSVTPSNGNFFCEIRNNGNNSTIYLDYPSPISNESKINIGKISADNKFNVSDKATLLLVDSKLQGKEYNVSVSVKKENKDDDDDNNNNNNNSSSGSSHGSSSSKAVTKPSVNSGSNGSVKISSDGKTITITPDKGYKVKDVLIDGKSVGSVLKYTFDKVSKDSTVKVIFEPEEKTPVKQEPVKEEPAKSEVEKNNVFETTFADIPANYWAKDAISFAVSNGLFYGTDTNQFSPNMNMTRSMFVTVLKRFEKFGPQYTIECTTPAVFNDVSEGNWYSESVSWAGGTGLVSGTGENNFSPDAAITREQLAVMIVNFAQKCNIEMPQKEQSITFNDSESISPWAKEAVSKVQQAGILYGKDGGLVAPQALATRAEVAAMLERFVKISAPN